MATAELQIVLQKAAGLSQAEKVEVIKRLADSLRVQSTAQPLPKMLEYGKYQNHPGKLTDEEDFALAEWHPSAEELAG